MDINKKYNNELSVMRSITSNELMQRDQELINLYESKDELIFYDEEGERINLDINDLVKFCSECYRIIIKSLGALDALDNIYYALYNVGGKNAWVNVFMLGLGEYRYCEDEFKYMKCTDNFNEVNDFLNAFKESKWDLRCSKIGLKWTFGVIDATHYIDIDTINQ